MTIFAVDRYLDRLITPAKKETGWNDEDRYHYFDTEQEAKDFIIQRASNDIDATERKHRAALKRYQKCVKKYGAKP